MKFGMSVLAGIGAMFAGGGMNLGGGYGAANKPLVLNFGSAGGGGKPQWKPRSAGGAPRYYMRLSERYGLNQRQRRKRSRQRNAAGVKKAFA